MAYRFYLDSIQIPLPPEEMKIKIENRNETISLLNGSTANILKNPGLTEVSFTLLLPNQKYSFLENTVIWHSAEYYLEKLEILKTSQKAFHFVVTRFHGNEVLEETRLFGTDLLVTLEEYQIREAFELGFDCEVEIQLKQYAPFSSKRVQTISKSSNGEITAIVESVTARTNTREMRSTYTASGEETLWEIACIVYGDGDQWESLYQANADRLENKSGIVPAGTELRIPWRR